jgi:hypothetical protein
MMSYRDMTYCASDCTNTGCFRHVKPELEKKAEAVGLLVAFADFHETCSIYMPPLATTEETRDV